MLPLEGAAVAYHNTFFHGQIDLLLYLCFNWQLFSESYFTLMRLKYFMHYTDCLQTFLLILQLIMLSLHSQFTTVVKSCLTAAFGTESCLWCVLCRGMLASQAASNQYCPRSILVSPPPAWLHSTRTRAIRSFIALAWGGDLVHNVQFVSTRVLAGPAFVYSNIVLLEV